jgi:protein-arginine kinase activator protein McsA
MEDDKKIKDRIIDFYELLLEDAIKKEEYENAIKYKKFLDNLKKSGAK